MAAMLKRENQLMSLRVELAFWAREPTLQIGFEHGGEQFARWEVGATEAGVPPQLEPGLAPGLQLPPDVTSDLARLCREHAEHGQGEPLWLQLIRPYGYAGVMPWEAVLSGAVGRPVLRLPDFLERSQEDPDTLEMAVCYDPPWSADRQLADLQVAGIIQTALASPRAQIVVHVFSPEPSPQIIGLAGPRVRVHEPPPARTFQTGAGPSATPWTDWIFSALERRALDALHFVCAADAADERASLLLRANPAAASTPTGTPAVNAIQPADVAGFLTRVGAWAAIFSPLPGLDCASASRYFADCLAQVRPGPVLFSPLDDGPVQQGPLPQLYKFLFSPEPSQPPVFGGSFLYCQPTLARCYHDGPASFGWDSPRANVFQRTLAKVSQSVPGLPDYLLPEAPAWTSASQRYVEKLSLDNHRLEQGLAGLSSDALGSAGSTSDAVSQTLAQIQAVIAKSRGGEG